VFWICNCHHLHAGCSGMQLRSTFARAKDLT